MPPVQLTDAGLSFDVNRAAPLVYKGVRLRAKYFLDLIVENTVAVELKSIAVLCEIHKKQLLSQLRLTNFPVGLLINFNVAYLTDGGVKRIINGKFEAAPTHPEHPSHEDKGG